MVGTDDSLPSDDALREHAYLVARSVRPVAIAGNCPADPEAMMRAMSRLKVAGAGTAIPFVIDEGDGIATCGYASHPWAVDLLQWALTLAPAEQVHRILGLLLGYGADSIERHEALGAGQLFPEPPGLTSSRRRGASRRHACTSDTAGTHAHTAS
jgi:hypothetical protein